MSENNVLLQIKDLKMYFPIKSGFFQRTVAHVKAVDGVSFEIKRGETLGLVGESGCGKTTIGRCIVRAYQPTDGEILYGENSHAVDLAHQSETQLKDFRRVIRMIFQDPYASLNPRMTVFNIVADPLRIHNIASGKDLEKMAENPELELAESKHGHERGQYLPDFDDFGLVGQLRFRVFHRYQNLKEFFP